MKALILNSGIGSRLGELTKEKPKCMTELVTGETIVSRQLKLLEKIGVAKTIITTGKFNRELEHYCDSLKLNMDIKYIYNSRYMETNYIYSMYLARKELDDDIILLHGDLVFDEDVLKMVYEYPGTCMVVEASKPLPEKDFKAVVNKEGVIEKVGVEFFDSALTAQPLYKFEKSAWQLWQEKIVQFCNTDQVTCYAENALNEVTKKIKLCALDVQEMLCSEIDDLSDLKSVNQFLKNKDKEGN